MPINTEQFRNPALSEQERRAKINANMKQLDYSSGNGLLKAEKKTLSPSESYLFIGIGGTGQKALRSIKETINKTIKPNCHEQQVRYLVVDCAENELNQLVRDGVFEQSEIMLIPYQGAHDTISPQHIASDKKNGWIRACTVRQEEVFPKGIPALKATEPVLGVRRAGSGSPTAEELQLSTE